MGIGGKISGVWGRSGINKRATSLRVSSGALEMRCVRCSYRTQVGDEAEKNQLLVGRNVSFHDNYVSTENFS